MPWGQAHTDTTLLDLREAVREYLNELDNPAPDPTMRKIRRDRLRELVNIPEPPRINRPNPGIPEKRGTQSKT